MSSPTGLYSLLKQGRVIRLVEILPGERDAPLSCTLIETSLDSQHQYRALSYVWGDVNIRAPILCNGIEFHVTLNLISAMKQIRSVEIPVTFWIDAICINQDDLKERAAQVQMMRDIYRSAELVIVHLGEDVPGL